MTREQRMLLNTLRLALAAVAIGLAAGPFFLADTQLGVLADFFSMLVLAIMWNLLAGYADIVTIGQHAFVGVGAYAFYAFAALAGVDPYLSIPLAGVVALIVALPAMALLFRLRTVYFSIGTWVVAEVLMLGAGKIEAFGGGTGISVPIEILRAFGLTRSGRLATTYWLGFALAMFALGSTYLLLRSRFGVGLMAMRDNEESAASVGVNVTRARILCFLGVAPVLGITGALITFIVVIGGIGTIEGPILGTIFFFVLREYLSDLGTWHLILLGVSSIAIIMIDRRGICGLIRRFALPADLISIAHRSSSQNL